MIVQVISPQIYILLSLSIIYILISLSIIYILLSLSRTHELSYRYKLLKNGFSILHSEPKLVSCIIVPRACFILESYYNDKAYKILF